MYSSTVTVKEFIDTVVSGLDMAEEVDRDFLIAELSTLEQLLYCRYIFDQRMVYPAIEDGEIDLCDIIIPAGEREVRADDVIAVMSNGYSLKKTTLYGAFTVGSIGGGCYWRASEDRLEISLPEGEVEDDVVLFYLARPVIKTSENEADTHVALPDEFLSLVRSKLYGEAYFAAGDDAMAAKWLGEIGRAHV